MEGTIRRKRITFIPFLSSRDDYREVFCGYKTEIASPILAHGSWPVHLSVPVTYGPIFRFLDLRNLCSSFCLQK